MKKYLFFLLIITCVMETDAQDIVGKWKYTKEFLDSLAIHHYFPKMKGSCKFKKNGEFFLRIDGKSIYTGRREVQRATPKGPKVVNVKTNIGKSMYIKVNGRYSVEGNTISTEIPPDGVKAFIDCGRDHPSISNPRWENLDLRIQSMLERSYEVAVEMAAKQAQIIETELVDIWRWDHVPIEFHGDTLYIVGREKLVK